MEWWGGCGASRHSRHSLALAGGSLPPVSNSAGCVLDSVCVTIAALSKGMATAEDVLGGLRGREQWSGVVGWLWYESPLTPLTGSCGRLSLPVNHCAASRLDPVCVRVAGLAKVMATLKEALGRNRGEDQWGGVVHKGRPLRPLMRTRGVLSLSPESESTAQGGGFCVCGLHCT